MLTFALLRCSRATSGDACALWPSEGADYALTIQVMARLPRVAASQLVEAAIASLAKCPCECPQSNRNYIGALDANEDTAFVLLWESLASEEQLRVRACGAGAPGP